MKRTGARVIGIDLGTTNTVAAFADGRVPRVIPTEKGQNLLASVVAFVGDRVLVGQPAKDQLLLHPQETVYGAKRLLGRAFHSPQVAKLRARFAYPIVEGERGLAAVNVGGRVRSLTEISAILLRQIGLYAAHHLGGPIDGCVISVPAYYPEGQREAVRLAAKEAGLDVWRLVNEPTAAAIAYGVGRGVEQRVLVFDLGGGTFDVSILEIGGGTFQVLATGGDGFLGGVDFDIALADHLLESFTHHEGIDLSSDATVSQRILSASEQAKIDLSLLQHSEVRLPFVAEKRGKPVDLWLKVDRAMLQQLTEPLIERALVIVDRALKDAGLKPSDIDEVLLAGGQTRMPRIQQRIEEFFGKPPRRGVHPDEVVAQGAALLARSLAQGDDLRLIDVLSVPIGFGGVRGGHPFFEPIIARGTTLPHEETMLLPTTTDGQTAFELDLFQSTTADLTDAEYMGTLLYDGLVPDRKGARALHLDFHLDADALLTVRAHHGNRNASVQLRPVRRPRDYLDDLELSSTTAANRIVSSEQSRSLLARFFGKR
jgi:molecular chaperone DnaK